MDQETQRDRLADLLNTVPKCMNRSSSFSYATPPIIIDLETTLIINYLLQNDKNQLINLSKRHFTNTSSDLAALVSKFLRVSCIFDSVNCVTPLVNRDLGPFIVVNEVDKSSGLSAIHLAAESHEERCVELLLEKRACTDVRSKDGRELLPPEMFLSCSRACFRMNVIWNPDDCSVEDLVAILGEKARYEAVIEILLKSKSIDVNDADADGNSALHCALKISLASCQHVLQNRTVRILLKDGAILSQLNKLGLTALHNAAGSGNLQALEDLIQNEADCINFKTLMMETPLFFVVKKDQVCAELLLRWGENSEVLNLRERPIDFAKSQDMRFLLTAANTCHTNLTFLNQEKQNASLESDEDVSETCEVLLSMIDDDSNTSVQAHFVTIMGKQVEIKSATPKELLPAELQKQSAQQQEPKYEHQSQLQAKIPGERTMEETASRKIKEETPTTIPEEATPEEKKSLACRLLHGQAKTSSNESQAHIVKSLEEKNRSKWLRTFKKWLPRFLKDVYRHPLEEKYALSSLKTDFKAAYGLELDHASLGYPNLSDFIRTLPHLCHVKARTIGKNGSPNHMVLVPSLPRRKGGALQSSRTENPSPPVISASNGNEFNLNDSRSPQDLQSLSISSTIEGNPTREVSEGSSSQSDTSTSASWPGNQERYTVLYWLSRKRKNNSWLQSLSISSTIEGNPTHEVPEASSAQSDTSTSASWPGNQERHMVLYWLSRKRKNNSLFAREFDFQRDYKACVEQKNCFGCKKQKMLFLNIPCQCPLWCGDCKQEVTEAVAGLEHICVICDKGVQDTILKSDPEEFPPLSLSNTSILSEISPLNC